MKTVKFILVLMITQMIAEHAFAQNWILATTLTNVVENSFRSELLISVASSADGKMLAGAVYYPMDDYNPPYSPLYISTNSNTNWLAYFPWFIWPNWFWWSYVITSADGTKLVAASEVSGQIYTSTNSGIDWNLTSAPNYEWSSMASSADGNILVAAGWNAPVCVSTNFGATWMASGDPGLWTSVAASSDGSKMVATSTARSNAIFVSTNYGISWASTVCPPWFWVSVASSADGKKLVAGAQSPYGGIVTSTNSGANWMITSAPNTNWISVASSADGNILVAAVRDGQIFTSTNSGAVWTESHLPDTNWVQVASSADGGNLIAITSDGRIYAAHSAPPPVLNIQSSGNNQMLSWVIPSTDFVLQESTGLNSWIEVTNLPVLNLTNLQNVVTLSSSNRSSGFYRLKTP